MTTRLLSILCALLMSVGIQAQNAEFETAVEAVKNMKVGWNLWNTLDTSPGVLYDPANYKSWETGWGNPEATSELMKMMRKAGFNAIRVPVTWYPYTDENGNVDSRWMARVHEVVDYVIDQGMYCLLNVHHDTGEYETSWIRADETNYQKNHERFENIWRQIAEEFKDYDEHLLFEGYNEMLDIWGSWGRAAWWHDDQMESVYTSLNNYAQSFVNTVRSTGGNNKKRNLVVNTYAASMDTGEGFPLTELRIPDDEAIGHIAIQIHYYPDEYNLTEKEIDETVDVWSKAVQSKGAPLIVGEWGMWSWEVTTTIVEDEEYVKKITSLSRYFIEKTKANEIATFNWAAPICGGAYRSLPAFISSEYINALMKGYYGDWYEPTLITEDDYDFQGVKVSFDYQWAELTLYDGEIDLNEYSGIRVEVENTEGLMVKFYGNPDDKWQFCGMTSTSGTFTFDKSSLGNKVTGITLQNVNDGKNETKLLNACLIRKDGTEETIDFSKYGAYHGCEYEVIMPRKQFVHTVEYDYQWAELNIFYDDIPLKLKNYKGIRLELAEMPKDVHVKVYGDGGQKEEYIGINDASSTILFNTDIFSNEINRVTLQYTKEGKGEAKVISAWLIRQDGTEEYSDLSPFHGCNITNVEKYVPEASIAEIQLGAGKTMMGYSYDKTLDFINVTNGKAWIAAGFVENSKVMLCRVNIVPANTGFIVTTDTPGDKVIAPVSNDRAYYANLLVPILEQQTIYPRQIINGVEYTFMGIGTIAATGKTGFVKVANERSYGPNKCLLRVPTQYLVSEARGLDELEMVFDDATGIREKVTVKSEQFATAPVYNLNGQRVDNSQFIMHRSAEGRLLPAGRKNAQLQKGVYIVNGKKVIIN